MPFTGCVESILPCFCAMKLIKPKSLIIFKDSVRLSYSVVSSKGGVYAYSFSKIGCLKSFKFKTANCTKRLSPRSEFLLIFDFLSVVLDLITLVRSEEHTSEL